MGVLALAGRPSYRLVRRRDNAKGGPDVSKDGLMKEVHGVMNTGNWHSDTDHLFSIEGGNFRVGWYADGIRFRTGNFMVRMA